MITARNRTEPPVNRRFGFEATPKLVQMLSICTSFIHTSLSSKMHGTLLLTEWVKKYTIMHRTRLYYIHDTEHPPPSLFHYHIKMHGTLLLTEWVKKHTIMHRTRLYYIHDTKTPLFVQFKVDSVVCAISV